jgi:hypothetical protein
MWHYRLPPEPSLPAITYYTVAAPADVDTHADLYVMTRFQTDVYAETKAQAETIAAAMLAALHMYTGTVSGQHIVSITRDYAMDMKEPETGLFRVTQDFKVRHKGA